MEAIECNEPVDKAMPPEVVGAMFQLLKQYGVPVNDWVTWIYAQGALYQQLKDAYNQQKQDQ